MTINSQTTRVAYQGNGTTTEFDYQYPFFAASDLQVILFDSDTNALVDPQPVLNGDASYDYTVTGTQDSATGEYTGGAEIAFNTAPPGDYLVVILAAIPYTQNLSLQDNSKFSAGSVNAAFDRLTLLCQQLLQSVGYAVTAPDTDAGPGMTLPPAATRAGGILAFDGSGNVIVPAGATLGEIEAAIAAFNASSDAITTVGALMASAFGTGTTGQVLTSNGGDAVPSFQDASGGGGSGVSPFDDPEANAVVAPVATDYTVTQGSNLGGQGSLDNLASRGVVLSAPPNTADGPNVILALKSVDSFASLTGWTMLAGAPLEGDCPCGIVVGDGTGKFITCGTDGGGGAGYSTWTNVNTAGDDSASVYPALDYIGLPLWWRIALDGATLTFSWSADGENFNAIESYAYTGFMGTITEVGFWANNMAGSDDLATVFDVFSLVAA